jgi:glycerophosphoryl diester phosphodiesterase
LVLGHRGARAFEPENTISAFRRALDDGADGVELDVRLTSDGQPVLSHDDVVDFAGLDSPRCISRLTSSQLAHLTLKHGQRLATLREALIFQAETGCLMNIELKADGLAPGCLVNIAAREIALHGGDSLLISSFSPHIVWKAARLLPGLPIALLVEEPEKFSKRWLPLGYLPYRLLGADGVHPERTLIEQPLLRRMRKKGCFVGAWTINDPGEAVELAQWGVDVLIGDDPGALVRALSSGRSRENAAQSA